MSSAINTANTLQLSIATTTVEQQNYIEIIQAALVSEESISQIIQTITDANLMLKQSNTPETQAALSNAINSLVTANATLITNINTMTEAQTQILATTQGIMTQTQSVQTSSMNALNRHTSSTTIVQDAIQIAATGPLPTGPVIGNVTGTITGPQDIQKYYTAALQNPNPAVAIAAAHELTDSIDVTVNALITAGAIDVASAVIIQAIQLLYTSAPYKKNDASIVSMIQNLRNQLTQLQTAMPAMNASSAQASAADASAKETYYTSALKNADVSVSANAAQDIVKNVTATVAMLSALGSFSDAETLISQTLNMLIFSTAFSSGNPQVVSLVNDLVRMQTNNSSANPTSGPKIPVTALVEKKDLLNAEIAEKLSTIDSFLQVLNNMSSKQSAIDNANKQLAILRAALLLAQAEFKAIVDSIYSINPTAINPKDASITSALVTPPKAALEVVQASGPVANATGYGEGYGERYGEGYGYGEGY